MSGGAAAETMRTSAVRLNHRMKRFAGANALKKIALNVIAKVGQSTLGAILGYDTVCRVLIP